MEKKATKHIEKNENVIKGIFFKFVPYWPLFLLTLMISGVYFYFKIKYTTPIFETTASVLIKDEKKGQEDSKMEEVLNIFGAKKIVENELEILRSNSIVIEVARNLKLYAPVYSESGWRGMTVLPAYFTCPVELEAENPENLKSSDKIYFSLSKDNASVTFNGSTHKVGEWLNTPYGKIRFIQNTRYAESGIQSTEGKKFYFTLFSLDIATKNVIGNLIVTPASKQSSVINITYKDEVPSRGENLIASIIQQYNEAGMKRKNETARQTLYFIQDRLNQVSRELDSLESGIQKYRDRSGVINISEQSKLYLSSIGTNDHELNALNIKMASLEQAENYIKNKENEASTAIAPATMNIEDPTLNGLLEKLNNTQTQYEKMKKTSGENNPKVLTLLEEINKTKPTILENIRNQRKSLQAGKEYLTKVNNQYNSMLSGVPRKEKELVEVSRQQNIKNDIYSFLLQKREETAYSISSILPDCYIVSNPTTKNSPISPKKPFLALLALILPFSFSTAVVLMKDMFNQKVMYRTDIEKTTRFPVIGEVIYEKLDSSVVTECAPNSFIVEQFRQIRSVLKYHAQPSGVLKRLLVTSFVKGEGKSFISVNLAMSLARSGKKVAILELDLYQPKVSEYLEQDHEVGITDYLKGEVNAEDIIFKTTKHENLYILTAGRLVEEPSELLVNGKIEILLNYLDKQFDVVLIDSSPFKPLTDSLTIAPLVNLMLVVTRHNHTSLKLLERFDEDMESQHIENIAMIFNGVKNRGVGRYSYGYGYGYGYDHKSAYKEYHKKKIKKAS